MCYSTENYLDDDFLCYDSADESEMLNRQLEELDEIDETKNIDIINRIISDIHKLKESGGKTWIEEFEGWNYLFMNGGNSDANLGTKIGVIGIDLL